MRRLWGRFRKVIAAALFFIALVFELLAELVHNNPFDN